MSVIVPTRDRVALLRRAVASVCAQSEQRFELIIVDDGSSDGTAAYLDGLGAADRRVRIVHNAVPAGGGGARNAGIRVSRGEWVAFIDDDDEWLPEKLERQLQAVAVRPTAVACSCGYRVVSASGAAKVIPARANVTVAELLIYNSLGGASTCLCSGATLREIGGFDASLSAGQDLDLWVRLRQRGEVAVCGETLVLHRAHPGPRITTNAHSQYLGVRHFYFKHRGLMNDATRHHRVAYCCYVMSMQRTRRPWRRLRFLAIALRHALPRHWAGFVRKSAPLFIRDALSGDRAAVTPTYAARK